MPIKMETKTELKSPEAKAAHFLAQSGHFRLGHLPTESRHPRTVALSRLAETDLAGAIELLKDVEIAALTSSFANFGEIEGMAATVASTLARGGRIFLVGCGATGRLSLSLETLWREETKRLKRDDMHDRVFSFIAGGDYALVRSIENFEDHPEYGARQLHDLGFRADDLLIGTSEGGETPFVIGAVEEAARIASTAPYFLFCNPKGVLAATVERSRRVIESPRVRSICLETGPMALAGSTRLQATTALMLGTGAALFSSLERPKPPKAYIDEFVSTLRGTDFSALSDLIVAEADVYADGGICLHRTSRYGITVLTDTTERSPTFSLLPFESLFEKGATPAWTFLCHSEAKNAADSWVRILGRSPRALEWENFKERFGPASLNGFDFSPESQKRRAAAAGKDGLQVYDIEATGREIALRFQGHEARLTRPATLLAEHLLLKVALNISSTLLMGRLGRFSGNLMLFVRAANNKLVDRAIRYVQFLLQEDGIEGISYDDICLCLFRTTEALVPDEPAVWRTFERLRAEARPRRSGS